jgi:tetratricopeptide (TPR) repeat protein
MMKLKNLAFCLPFLLAHFPAFSQEKPYDDLLVLYVDENYEKCIEKSERYVDRDATHRDALPYLYASMCWFEISKIPKFTAMDEYKRADREALKWASKYRRKDKNLEFFANYEDFWSELNTVAQEMGLNYMDEKSFSKAKQQFQRITRYNPENPGAWQMLALAQTKGKAVRDAQESTKQFKEALKAVPDVAHLPLDQRNLLRESLLRTARSQEAKGQVDKARETIALGKDYFMDNPEFKSLYQSLEGSASK